jgi:hypothetical protein
MSDQRITNQAAPNQHMPDHVPNDEGFEQEDMSSSSALYFFAGLVALCVVIFLIVFGMYRALDSYQSANQPALSPLATPEADTRIVTRDDPRSFPQPRLEASERTELGPLIEDQDRTLATYDWVDKSKGTVRIPIDRAMELIAQRGLPVRPGAGAGAGTSTGTDNK